MSENTLRDAIQSSMIAAMRAKEKEKLGVIRLIQAAIKQEEIDARAQDTEQTPLSDQQVLELLAKMIKQRRESIQQYTAANREDLATKERFEIDVIQTFLPTPLTADELKQLIQEAMQASGAASIRDMGKVMALLKPKIQGRADPSEVAAQIKAQLNT